MQTFQQYFYENKTILSHIMESRSGKWNIFIKFASSFEVLSFSIRSSAKFGRHLVSYLFRKPLAYRRRAAEIVGDGIFFLLSAVKELSSVKLQSIFAQSLIIRLPHETIKCV